MSRVFSIVLGQAWNRVRDRVCQVGPQVWNQGRAQVEDRVWDQVNGPVLGRIRDQIREAADGVC